MRDREDRRLVERIACGEGEALALLYDRHCAAAYGLAYRVLADRGLAEDAVQEGFLCVWQNAGRYHADRATVQVWVLVFVHRRAVDAVRRARCRQVAPTDGQPSHPPAADDAFTATWARERRTRVQAALSRLAPEQRRVLELAYYSGYTQREIAEREQIPLGTVKSRMFAGLSLLRDLLA